MGRETLKIVLSLIGAGALALCVLVVMQAVLLSGNVHSPGADLFRFQLSSMFALAVFAGMAIVLYARLSRYRPPTRLTRWRVRELLRKETGEMLRRETREGRTRRTEDER